jgi:hypothetical protein
LKKAKEKKAQGHELLFAGLSYEEAFAIYEEEIAKAK